MKYFFAVVSGLLLASFSAAEQIKVSDFGTMKIQEVKDFRAMVFCTNDKGAKDFALVINSDLSVPLVASPSDVETNACYATDSCAIWDVISEKGGNKIADLMATTIDGTLSYKPSSTRASMSVIYYGGGQVVNIPQANVTVTQKVKRAGALYFNGYTGCTGSGKDTSVKVVHGIIYQKNNSKAQTCVPYSGNQTLTGAKSLGDYNIRIPEKLAVWSEPEVEETFTCSGAASSFVALTSVLFAMLSTVGFFRL